MPAPLVAGAVWTFITIILSSLIIRVVIALGVGIIVYSGIDAGLDAAQTYIETEWSGLPAYMLQLLGILQLDTAIAIILAAYSARFTIQMIGGTLSRLSISGGEGSIW
mgnify:CR=1 FL=1